MSQETKGKDEQQKTSEPVVLSDDDSVELVSNPVKRTPEEQGDDRPRPPTTPPPQAPKHPPTQPKQPPVGPPEKPASKAPAKSAVAEKPPDDDCPVKASQYGLA